MDLERKIVQCKHYLESIGILSGKPKHELSRTEMICVDPRGWFDEYYHQYPFWQPTEVEVHKNDFEALVSDIDITNRAHAQEWMMGNVPNNSNSSIIEVGSDYGETGAGYIATQKPSVDCVLVSRTNRMRYRNTTFLFKHNLYNLPHAMDFKKGQDLVAEEDIEIRVNALYRANGINNVAFHGHNLISNQVPDFLAAHRGKEIHILGHRSPAELPFIAGQLYNELDAESLYISLTASEIIAPSSFVWNMVQETFDLSNVQLGGYMRSSYDDLAHYRARKGREIYPQNSKVRYDYNWEQSPEHRIGEAIKLGFALTLAKSVGGTVLRGVDGYYPAYNQAGWYVQVKRSAEQIKSKTA